MNRYRSRPNKHIHRNDRINGKAVSGSKNGPINVCLMLKLNIGVFVAASICNPIKSNVKPISENDLVNMSICKRIAMWAVYGSYIDRWADKEHIDCLLCVHSCLLILFPKKLANIFDTNHQQPIIYDAKHNHWMVLCGLIWRCT